MRSVIGQAGSIIKRSRYWRRGFWSGKRSGGKKWTPALTLPQIRQGIAAILRETFQCGTIAHILAQRQKRLQRNELARFYHWKQHNRLAPLNLYLLYPLLYTPVASRNLLLYQSLPTSFRCRHALLRRRKDDTCVGTAARGIVE